MTGVVSVGVDRLAGNARRDRWGRYLVVPPDSATEVGYTRVTTVAAALDDGGGLAAWKASLACSGLIMRPGLSAQWEALLAEHPNPWYGTPDSKKQCKRLVEECAAVGGANDRREIGTALHTISALVDLGETPPHLTPETGRDVKAYREGLAAAGIEVVPGMVEVTVVLDSYQVAGTFDRLVTIPEFDLPLVADLKTGTDLRYSWQSIAIQLAAYAHADCIYSQGPKSADDQRIPMPAVDLAHGLVMWLNAGSGTLELHLVDLEAGWEAFGLAMRARAWRQKRHLNLPFTGQAPAKPTGPDDVEDTLAASLKSETADTAPQLPALREWLQQRIDIVGRHSPQARETLGRYWPAGMPSLRSSPEHSDEQLAAIEHALDRAEAKHTIPFGDPKPTQTQAAAARVSRLFKK